MYRCPNAVLNEQLNLHVFIQAYSWTRRGEMGGACVLPESGGLLDQSIQFMEAVSLFDSWMAEFRPDPEK